MARPAGGGIRLYSGEATLTEPLRVSAFGNDPSGKVSLSTADAAASRFDAT